MAAAANYAWANRQMITLTVRQVLSKMFGIAYEDMPLIYDVAHNVAKIEEHSLDNRRMNVCVPTGKGPPVLSDRLTKTPPDISSIGRPSSSRAVWVLIIYPEGDCRGHGKQIREHLPWSGKADEPFPGQKNNELAGKW